MPGSRQDLVAMRAARRAPPTCTSTERWWSISSACSQGRSASPSGSRGPRGADHVAADVEEGAHQRHGARRRAGPACRGSARRAGRTSDKSSTQRAVPLAAEGHGLQDLDRLGPALAAVRDLVADGAGGCAAVSASSSRAMKARTWPPVRRAKARRSAPGQQAELRCRSGAARRRRADSRGGRGDRCSSSAGASAQSTAIRSSS